MTNVSDARPAPDPSGQPPAAPVLRVSNITAGYGRSTVLRDVSIDVPPGCIVALLGPNGAGKTTLLRTVAGLLRPASGEVWLNGIEVTKSAPHRRARACALSLRAGGSSGTCLSARTCACSCPPEPRQVAKDGLEQVLSTFPVLRDRLGQTAGTMSGGQQQLLALARCYLTSPRVVLLDEVSMGLAPKVVDEIFAAIVTLASSGVALVLVEQYVNRALELASSAVLLDRGTVAYTGRTRDVDEAAVLRGYLGVDVGKTQPASSSVGKTADDSNQSYASQ